jgi:hypothetical protein
MYTGVMPSTRRRLAVEQRPGSHEDAEDARPAIMSHEDAEDARQATKTRKTRGQPRPAFDAAVMPLCLAQRQAAAMHVFCESRLRGSPPQRGA